MTNIIKWFKDTKKPHPIEFAVALIAMLFFFLTYFYTDVAITTRSGIDFWTYLFHGQILDFYELSKDMTFYDTLHCDALYDFTLYIVFAVWDFPLWVVERLFSIDALLSTPCLLWAKSIMLPFLAGCVIFLRKIGTLLGFSKEKSLWCQLIFLTSAFVISPIFVLCQYDIIGIFFSVVALYYYLKGDLKKFTVFMAVAVTMKTFALFVFLPLLLLKEKKMSKVCAYTLGCLSLFLGTQILFTLLGTTPAGSFLFAQMNKMMMGTLTTGLGNASIFIMIYLAILLLCYLRTVDNDYELKLLAVYVPFVVWAAFFVFSESSPYWIILITPYFSLMVCENISRFKVNLWLDTLAGIGLILAQNLFFPWVFSYKWLMPLMPFAKLVHPINTMVQENNLSILGEEEVLTTFTTTFGLPMCLGIFAFAMLALIILNYPSKTSIKKTVTEKQDNFSTELHVERSVIWLRFAASVGVCLIPFFFYLLNWILGL